MSSSSFLSSFSHHHDAFDKLFSVLHSSIARSRLSSESERNSWNCFSSRDIEKRLEDSSIRIWFRMVDSRALGDSDRELVPYHELEFFFRFLVGFE